MKFKPFPSYIVLEDENLIAINKPAMISSLKDRAGILPNIQEWANDYLDTTQLCHRLDKETSGILLIAKNPATYREIAIKFEKRDIEKTYWAIADGRHYFKNLAIEIPLAVSSRGRAKVDKQDGKPAETDLTVIETFKHFSLIQCKPTTGRLHQIRIHLATQNAPITGDSIYGGSTPFLNNIKRNFKLTKGEEIRPMIQRAGLHAESIKFDLYGKPYNIKAPLPKDMAVFLKLLRKYDHE
ncbi:MAG: 23S rRNA pseudouridine955/2504/2580 synthase [Bacteroidia bacterium]|jgi:23S rRNA pseudouridine955/2504/2580 synthase